MKVMHGRGFITNQQKTVDSDTSTFTAIVWLIDLKTAITQVVAYPTTSRIARVVRSDEARDLFVD